MDDRPSDQAEFNAGIEELARQERRILAALDNNPEATEQFLTDPGTFLRRLRIPVPAAVAHRLRQPRANSPDSLVARPIVLPNGQTITPKVTVRITGRRP